MSQYPRQATFVYERDGVALHIVTKNMTNHELRNILIGFWLTLGDADKRDHIHELTAYLEPGSWPPPMSATIAQSVIDARARDN